MNESQFIQVMIVDGWQALDASGNVVKLPRNASRTWRHSKTGQEYSMEHTDIIEGETVHLWQRFAEAGQTPAPF